MKNFKKLGDKPKPFTSLKDKQTYKDSQPKYKTNRWKIESEAIRNRWIVCCYPAFLNDGKSCIQPAKSVHHIKKADIFPKLFFLESNLIPLCNKCHLVAEELTGDDLKALIRHWREKIDIYRRTGKRFD